MRVRARLLFLLPTLLTLLTDAFLTTASLDRMGEGNPVISWLYSDFGEQGSFWYFVLLLLIYLSGALTLPVRTVTTLAFAAWFLHGIGSVSWLVLGSVSQTPFLRLSAASALILGSGFLFSVAAFHSLQVRFRDNRPLAKGRQLAQNPSSSAVASVLRRNTTGLLLSATVFDLVLLSVHLIDYAPSRAVLNTVYTDLGFLGVLACFVALGTGYTYAVRVLSPHLSLGLAIPVWFVHVYIGFWHLSAPWRSLGLWPSTGVVTAFAIACEMMWFPKSRRDVETRNIT